KVDRNKDEQAGNERLQNEFNELFHRQSFLDVGDLGIGATCISNAFASLLLKTPAARSSSSSGQRPSFCPGRLNCSWSLSQTYPPVAGTQPPEKKRTPPPRPPCAFAPPLSPPPDRAPARRPPPHRRA